MSGSITDPGKLSGKFSDVFLADRWFSLDHPISLSTEGITATALAESIKKVLVVEGGAIPPACQPVPPAKPVPPKPAARITFFNRVRPVAPTQVGPLVLPEAPVPLHFLTHCKNGVIAAIFVVAGIFAGTYYFLADATAMFARRYAMAALEFFEDWIDFFEFGLSPEDAERVASVLTIIAPLAIITFAAVPFEARKRNAMNADDHAKTVEAKSQQHAKALQKYDAAQKQYTDDTRREVEQHNEVQEDAARFARDQITYHRELDTYTATLGVNERRYAEERARVERARLMLWDRMRVCMRCGTAYLAP